MVSFKWESLNQVFKIHAINFKKRSSESLRVISEAHMPLLFVELNGRCLQLPLPNKAKIKMLYLICFAFSKEKFTKSFYV